MTVVGFRTHALTRGSTDSSPTRAAAQMRPVALPVRQAAVRFGYATLVRDISVRQELSWAVAAHTLNGGAELHRLSTTLDFMMLGDRNPNVPGSSIQGGAGLPDQLVSEIRSTRAAAWVEDTMALGSTLSLQSGLRVDRVGATGETLVSPRVASSWNLGVSTRVRAAFGRYTQSPGYEKLGQSDYLLDLTDPARLGLRSQQALVGSRGPRTRPRHVGVGAGRGLLQTFRRRARGATGV